MLKFFSDLSTGSIVVIAVLVILSFVFTHFWCRYLCPYGGLLGLISMISPFKISRNIETCINCKKCTEACPANIAVHRSKRVHSDECMACLECVESCPVEHTLEFKSKWYDKSLSGYRLAAVILIIYISFVSFGKITGHWDNSITIDEYIMRIQDIDNPVYEHNRGSVGVSEEI